jgi:hypothetical protein
MGRNCSFIAHHIPREYVITALQEMARAQAWWTY